MRVIDREQAKIVGGFRSTTRVNLRLLRLTRAKLLQRFFLGTESGGKRSIYALSQNGARAVDVPYRGIWRRAHDQMLIADFFVQHQLAINEIYCELKYVPIPISGVSFLRWVSFSKPLTTGLALIPDGYIELETDSGTVACFLEVDLGPEPLRVWKEKVANYLQFARRGEHERLFDQKRFGVLVVANSERRIQSLRRTVATLTDKIFWFTDFEAMKRKSFWGSVWMRPRADERHPFIPKTTMK